VNVLVIAPRDWSFVPPQVEKLRERNAVHVEHVSVTRGPRWWVALVAVVQGLFTTSSLHYDFDVIHAYSAWPAGIIGALIAWRANKPLIVHEHLSPPVRLFSLPLALKVLGSAARVACPSKDHADAVSRICGRPCCVVHNPVFVPANVVPMESSRVGIPRLVCVGRLVEQKGFDRIAAAAEFLPGWSVFIIGDGPDLRKLKAVEARCANLFVLPGRSHGAILRWLASADVVACPSRHESFGLVAAEAAALGRPVIATNVGQHASFASYLMAQTDSARDWAMGVSLAAEIATPKKLRSEYCPEAFADRMGELYDIPRAEEATA
jgi:glycosyltransferase involved in cell wall biosynthesis